MTLIAKAFDTRKSDRGSREVTLQAVQLLQQAVAMARHGEVRFAELDALYWISSFYRQMGSSDSALRYGAELQDAGRSYRIALGEAMGLFAQSQVYAEIERADSLARLADEALMICKQIGGCWFRNQLIALLAPFVVNRERDLAPLKALTASALASGDTVGWAALTDAVGGVYTEQLQQYDSALAYHRRLLQANLPERETIYGLGRTFRGLGMPDSALYYFRLLESIARRMGDLRAEGYALGNIGGTCHRDAKPPRLGCALAYYDSAASVASQVLRQAGRDMNRVLYGEQASQIYQEWPFAWLSTEDTIGKEAAILAALAVTELGRSEALRDLMTREQTRERIPPFGTVAVGLGRQLVSMLPVGSATLSYLIQSDTVLEWLTLPTREVRVYKWPVPFDSLKALVLALRSSLGADDSLARFRLRGIVRGDEDVHPGDEARFRSIASGLTNGLVPEDLTLLLPAGTDLVLIPQNVLNLVPFTALPIPGGTTLGGRYPIRYAPSLVALIQVEVAEAKAPPKSADRHNALVVSNPAMPVAEVGDGVRMRLSQLPGADSEGVWVAARLGARRLSGSLATESEVMREIGHADIIHFATHGYAYPYYSKARDSFLALAPDSTQDGLMTVGELLDDSSLSMPARLIVLSACQTALGSVTQAEGTIGLQRAFLARGARALLVSLWSVDDEATRLLMESFYNHWLGDQDSPTKAEALRRAQQDLRKIPRFASPLYWGAFALVGAN